MENFNTTFVIISTISTATFLIIFITVIAIMTSKKLRAKILSQQFNVAKEAVIRSKEDIRQASEAVADATGGAVKTTSKAVKSGFVSDIVFCKHCGSEIDLDSKYCKHCGKMQ